MKMDEIRELIQLMEQSDLEELEIEQDGVRLSMKKSLPRNVQQPVVVERPVEAVAVQRNTVETATEPQTAPKHEEAVDDSLHKIVSPMVGTFYQAPAPDAEPYVQAGDSVNEKTVVCIVEAMKLMNEIEAEVSGEIVKVLVENGQLVEYGQPLFLVRT